jgi:hypothetical protein
MMYLIHTRACHHPGRGECCLRAKGTCLPRLLAPTGPLGCAALSLLCLDKLFDLDEFLVTIKQVLAQQTSGQSEVNTES